MNSIELLESNIKRYAELYYRGEPEISDEEFDLLVLQLRALKPSSEVLKTGWGYNPKSSSLEKKNHLYSKMEGIGRKLRPEFITKDNMEFISLPFMTKLDGASVGVYYKKGKFDFALTRGNGVIGLDISDKISMLIPLEVDSEFTGRVRAEFILPREVFKSKYEPNGAKSPRNSAAGFLNTKSWNKEDIDDFRLIAYTVTKEDGTDYDTISGINILKKWKFDTVVYKDIKREYFSKDFCEFILNRMIKCYDSEIDCDGLVARDSSGLFAVKWNIEDAIATVKNVRWQQSRLGKFTPLVEIEPVELQDATIRKASGFNRKYIEDNNIGPGSVIRITRSGDIIPTIIEVIESTHPQIIDACPTCGSKLVNDGVDICCKNPSCSKTSVSRILNFIAVVAPVDGLGSSIITKYIDHINVSSIDEFIDKIINNDNNSLLYGFNSYDGIGQSAIDKIAEMNNKIRGDIESNRLLCGLGLKGLGLTYCNKLFEEYNIEKFINTLLNNDIDSIRCINVTGRESLKKEKDLVIDIFSKLTVRAYESSKNTVSKNIPVCITGKLSMSRKDFLNEISSIGACEVPIAKAEILITDNPDGSSSKNRYANEHGIKKMSEEEFRNMYIK